MKWEMLMEGWQKKLFANCPPQMCSNKTRVYLFICEIISGTSRLGEEETLRGVNWAVFLLQGD